MIGVAAKSDVIADLYRATATPRMVEVPEMIFLMIDGHGDPNTSSSYQDAVQALYALSYALKFSIKRSSGFDHKVAPLEGLWWATDLGAFTAGDKSAWDWTMIIRQPEAVTDDLLAETIKQVQQKKDLPAAANVRLEKFTEGRAAQISAPGPVQHRGAHNRQTARLHQTARVHLGRTGEEASRDLPGRSAARRPRAAPHDHPTTGGLDS